VLPINAAGRVYNAHSLNVYYMWDYVLMQVQ